MEFKNEYKTTVTHLSQKSSPITTWSWFQRVWNKYIFISLSSTSLYQICCFSFKSDKWRWKRGLCQRLPPAVKIPNPLKSSICFISAAGARNSPCSFRLGEVAWRTKPRSRNSILLAVAGCTKSHSHTVCSSFFSSIIPPQYNENWTQAFEHHGDDFHFCLTAWLLEGGR